MIEIFIIFPHTNKQPSFFEGCLLSITCYLEMLQIIKLIVLHKIKKHLCLFIQNISAFLLYSVISFCSLPMLFLLRLLLFPFHRIKHQLVFLMNKDSLLFSYFHSVCPRNRLCKSECYQPY